MTMSLFHYLYAYGYSTVDSENIVSLYYKNGIDIAAKSIIDWDDDTHDYTGELKDVIRQWEIETALDSLICDADMSLVYD